eukprot:Skav212664  [mRNA]  locus=scaffold1227:497626:497859:+ [translate_table: standard]
MAFHGYAVALRQILQCPITRELMVDPVLAADGYTYERQSILQHWENQLEGRRLRGDRIAANVAVNPWSVADCSLGDG